MAGVARGGATRVCGGKRRGVRATRGARARALRGTEGEVPPRSPLRGGAVLRRVPRPRGRAAARGVAVVEPDGRARRGQEALRRRTRGLRAQDERVPPATARL